MAGRTSPSRIRVEVAEYLSGETIQCLECGKHYRMLTGKLLRLVHGMTPDDYRKRWGLPYTVSLAGQAPKRIRSAVIRAMVEDVRLTHDHLPTATAAAHNAPSRAPPIYRAAQAELTAKVRPEDHSRLPPGAKRADGRDADHAREYQRRYREGRRGVALTPQTTENS